MNVSVNGAPVVIDAGVTITELVARHVESPKGVAVAVNAEVVPKSTWPSHQLSEGDHVEVLKAAQGG